MSSMCVAMWKESYLSVPAWQIVTEGFWLCCLLEQQSFCLVVQRGGARSRENSFSGTVLCAKYL